MIKGIIFDLDDTLCNEFDFVKSGYRVIAKKINKDFNYDEDYIYDLLNKLFLESSKNVYNRLVDILKINVDDNYINELITLYREHYPNIELSDDTINSLIECKKKGYRLGIISDGNYITQKNKVEALGLNKYIDKIILTDEYGKDCWKPNPFAFNLFMKEFNLTCEEVLYVGDNPKKDFYVKKYLNIKTVRLDNPMGIYYNEEYLENIREDFRIKNINEIIKF